MARLFFAVRQNFFEKPADHAPIALRNNAYRNQNNSCIRCDAARDTVIAMSTDSLVSPGKCAGPRCHALLIRASGTDVSDQEHQAVKVASLPAYAWSGGYRELSVSGQSLHHHSDYCLPSIGRRNCGGTTRSTQPGW